MLILDRMTTADSTRRRTGDGYLVAQAHIAKVGVQTYLGNEVGKPGAGIVRVYRPAEEVFDRASLTSFAHKPITVGHPPEGVTADNWRRHAVGYVGGEVLRDGDRIAVPLLFTDSAAIRQLEGGVQELSGGYGCKLDWTPGVTASGETYDAVQRKIRGNHVALVPQGRAGPTVRVGDAAYGGQQVSYMNDSQRAYEQMLVKDANAWKSGGPQGGVSGGAGPRFSLPPEMTRAMGSNMASKLLPIISDMNTTDAAMRRAAADRLSAVLRKLDGEVQRNRGLYNDAEISAVQRVADHCQGIIAVARAA